MSTPRETGGGSTGAGTAPVPGVCGPDVSAEVAAIWTKIQVDFRGWTAAQKADACSRILIPLKTPTYSPGTDPKTFIQSAADINGWDVLPLFQGASKWLRSYPIYDAATGGPCATPSSLNPSAPPFDDAHESVAVVQDLRGQQVNHRPEPEYDQGRSEAGDSVAERDQECQLRRCPSTANPGIQRNWIL